MLRQLPRALLDLCFPPRCLACRVGTWEAREGLCGPCLRALPPSAPRCPACGRRVGPFQAGAWGCPRCTGPNAERDALRSAGGRLPLRRRAVRGVVAAWAYTGPARDLVLGLKFHRRLPAATPLAIGLLEALRVARVPGDLVVPVPLSRRRRLARGYDQALLLARPVARRLGLEFKPRALRRHKHARPQSGRTRSERTRGLGRAFRARPDEVRGRCVILVDDVLTSGATARACAVALRRAGARAVTVAVACRAERRGPA